MREGRVGRGMNECANSAAQGRPGRLAVACLTAAFVLLFCATALAVILERRVFVLGPLSTLGLTVFVYLASIWCLAAAIVISLSGRDGSVMRLFAAVVRFAVVIVVVIATSLLGTAALDSASTPLYRIKPSAGSAEYLVRVGTALESNRLSLYRSKGRHFEFVTNTGLGTPDTRRFASDFRVERSTGGTFVLKYPGRDGRMARVNLPR